MYSVFPELSVVIGNNGTIGTDQRLILNFRYIRSARHPSHKLEKPYKRILLTDRCLRHSPHSPHDLILSRLCGLTWI